MKHLARVIASMMIVAMIYGCGMSTEEIGKVVQESMQETLSRNANFRDYNLKVEGVQVFKIGGNSYKGIATVKFKGSSNDVTVDIIVDGSNVMWEAAPGSFMFIVQEELQQLENLFESQLFR